MSINVEAEKRAYKKFRQAGMTAAGACGLIGNLEAESDGFYTNRVEYLCLKRLKENGKVYTDTTYTASIDSGKISCEEFLHHTAFRKAVWVRSGAVDKSRAKIRSMESGKAERCIHCQRRYADRISAERIAGELWSCTEDIKNHNIHL